MQLWSGQNAAGATTPTRKFITTVIGVFSLAGLVIGFAVGGLTHPQANQPANTNPTNKPTIVAQSTPTTAPTSTPPPDIALGVPQLTTYSITETATGNTQYTATMQAVDKKGKSVHSADITCKLWLIPQITGDQKLNIDPKILKNISGLNAAIPATLNGQPVAELPYLIFADPATQATKCNANGQATWKYNIAPGAVPGKYELVTLADWKGVHYNWGWNDIVIK